MSLNISSQTHTQINDCLKLLTDIFQNDLLGVYLYGSAILGGLQKYSDIDLFVILNRPSTLKEKSILVDNLLQISGIYMKSSKLPIEMTIVEKSKVNPWHYPPHFDFQYGDWLRKEFESGVIEPWTSKEMPDLALLITQVLLTSETLFGQTSDQLLCNIPYNDVIAAILHSLKPLMQELNSDTRNVLLAYARIWCTLKKDAIYSKPSAADWAIAHLPEEYKPVMKHAKAVCEGNEFENWDDLNILVKPCADYMLNQINEQIRVTELINNTDKQLKLAE